MALSLVAVVALPAAVQLVEALKPVVAQDRRGAQLASVAAAACKFTAAIAAGWELSEAVMMTALRLQRATS